jgi:hypothetical protein
MEFLGLPYSSFREIAPTLTRHAITPARFGYLRWDILAWVGSGNLHLSGASCPLFPYNDLVGSA